MLVTYQKKKNVGYCFRKIHMMVYLTRTYGCKSGERGTSQLRQAVGILAQEKKKRKEGKVVGFLILLFDVHCETRQMKLRLAGHFGLNRFLILDLYDYSIHKI
jgi:hypothetical protein